MNRYQLLAALLVTIGTALVVLGVMMWSVPAGTIAAGISVLIGGYVVAYMGAES